MKMPPWLHDKLGANEDWMTLLAAISAIFSILGLTMLSIFTVLGIAIPSILASLLGEPVSISAVFALFNTFITFIVIWWRKGNKKKAIVAYERVNKLETSLRFLNDAYKKAVNIDIRTNSVTTNALIVERGSSEHLKNLSHTDAYDYAKKVAKESDIEL